MSRRDYEAVAKIIEEVVGKDTLQGVKLLEGIFLISASFSIRKL